MAEQWLIDGYNLLRSLQSKTSQKAHPELAEACLPDRQGSREQLFEQVAQFAAFKKTNTLLVLDGVGNEDELRPYYTDSFRIVYSQKVSADTYIEQYLFRERGKLLMTVVTDDRAIANIGRGGGAQVLSTALFAETLTECRKERSDVVHKQRSKSHGFNRPFEDKLKDL